MKRAKSERKTSAARSAVSNKCLKTWSHNQAHLLATHFQQKICFKFSKGLSRYTKVDVIHKFLYKTIFTGELNMYCKTFCCCFPYQSVSHFTPSQPNSQTDVKIKQNMFCNCCHDPPPPPPPRPSISIELNCRARSNKLPFLPKTVATVLRAFNVG